MSAGVSTGSLEADDWADYLPNLDKLNLCGKKIALFALDDQVGYSYNFVSAMRILYDKLIALGAEIIVSDVENDGFEYDYSESVIDGRFIGLVLDEVNEPERSPERIKSWAGKLRACLTAALV